jgi:hypothetical protein
VTPEQPATPGQPVATGTDQLAALRQAIQKTFAGGGAPVTLGANLAAGVKQAAQGAVSSMLGKSPVSALTSTALAGTTGLGGAGAPSGGVLPAAMAGVAGVPKAILDMSGYAAKPVLPAGYTMQPSGQVPVPAGGLETAPYQMTTVQGAGLAPGFETGGGTKEAVRAAKMAKAGYDVIGTTTGAGYRTSATPASDNQPLSTETEAEQVAKRLPTYVAEGTDPVTHNILYGVYSNGKRIAGAVGAPGQDMAASSPDRLNPLYQEALKIQRANKAKLPSTQLKNVLGQYAPGSQYA